MTLFRLSQEPLDPTALRAELEVPDGDNVVVFEAHVPRTENHVPVLKAGYEAYGDLAVKEANRILAELKERYSLAAILCVHRLGTLRAGEMTLWLGAASGQSREAFWAAAQALDAIKKHVPIWKKEKSGNGRNEWVVTPQNKPASRTFQSP